MFCVCCGPVRSTAERRRICSTRGVSAVFAEAGGGVSDSHPDSSRDRSSVKLNRSGVALSLLAVIALLLAACNKDDSSSAPSSTTAHVDCGGKKVLKASGSTAQKNAIEQF